ncbi:Serine/threonine-protein phosphatase 2A activator 1 [Claviceps maximensis]|nr:Serine/threonine-protein phosphatase 2A activator 1 [Claviceps maximensis]
MTSNQVPLPTLQQIPRSHIHAHKFAKPSKRINEGHHVEHFLTTRAYADICTFILQLNHSLCPRTQADSSLPPVQFPLIAGSPTSTPSIQALQRLLSDIGSLVDQAPPDTGPRRFGNVSFRKWHALVEEKLDALLLPLQDLVFGDALSARGSDGVTAKDEVSSYLLGAFGSPQRLDYGTGHELSFIAFLACLWKLGIFRDGGPDGSIEREIVRNVIEPYLQVVRNLILTYTLEPAGSHGVWGLDDHAFIPYIFGSAQLTRPIATETEPMPLEGSVRGAPKPSDITKSTVVEDQRQINMYFSAIGFINDVKKGPFWEHSPILFDVSGVKDGWGKINKGMIKMYNAEVLSKFPVVQHFPFGSLFSWDIDPSAPVPTQSVHMTSQPMAMAATSAGHPVSTTGMAAPWAQATRMPLPTGPGIPYSRVPPASNTGSLASRQHHNGDRKDGTTAAQITITRAPWAQ